MGIGTIRTAFLETARLPLVTPLYTSRGDIAWRDAAVLVLGDERGNVAHGEGAPLPGFSAESFEEVTAELRALAARHLPGASLGDPAALVAAARSSAARHAIDQALLGLLARRRGVTLAEILHPAPRRAVPIHALVQDPREAEEAVRAGARVLKVKVGAPSLEVDEARLEAIRARIPAEIGLRLDANGAWSPGKAIDALHHLSRYGLACVEQPVAAEDIEGLARVRRAAPAPILADESVRGLDELERVIAHDAADAIVLKPMLLGGPSRALELAARAAEVGLPVSVTSLLDGAIAREAALAVAAAAPGVLWSCGLPSHLLAGDLHPLPRAPWIAEAPARAPDRGPRLAIERPAIGGVLARIGGRAA